MPQDFDLDQFKSTYFEECHDLLAAAEEYLGILQNEMNDVDVETLHAIFRCVHSIKGGAGTFNYTDLVSFSHVFEALLDKLRDRKIKLTPELVKTLYSANDVLVTLVQMAQDDEVVDPAIWEQTAKDLEAFVQETPPVVEKKSTAFAGYNKTEQEEEEQGWGLFIDEKDDLAPEIDLAVTLQPKPIPEPEPEPQEDSAASAVEEAVETDQSEETEIRPSEVGIAHYRIQFIPDSHLLRFANEPLLLSRELATLGQCYAYPDISKLPSLDEIKADEAYLSWIFELVSDCKLADIEEVFEFVIDDCDLKIDKIQAGTKPESENKDIVADQSASSPLKLAAPTSLEVADEKTPTVKKEAPKSESASASSSHKVSSIRVDLDRVDKLVNMVGELVISQAMLMQQAENLPNNVGETMSQGFENLSAHTRHLQESVMAIRMQPVKSVFARMPRLVRELSARLKKKVDLITSGEMTEVDKTVIEQLMDPITHMIRNSLDHGVESVEERIAAGKPERAKIQLNAEHRSGRIQIEVIDDGYGIDRKRVLEKAIAKGIVDKDDNLRDDEIDDLIFVPGFSTAKEVSNISGRGVGMDVVRRNIINLGGRISVFSSPGKGTRFLLSLPLTLAVLDGMIVQCGEEKYIIPLTSIIENIYPQPEELKKLGSGATLISVRGEYIRLVNLHRLFNIKGAVTDPVEGLVVIVETERYGLVGILVDELLGQQQVVIKSLEENYDPIAGVSAATILGNGKVALILDTDGLAQMEHGNSRRNFNELSKQVLLTGEQTNDVE